MEDLLSAGSEDPNRRAIRCDKTTPCSNCRVAMRTCSSIGVTHKPKEQRQRVLISHQYERKIDLIEERLSGIEEALRTIAASGVSFDPNRAALATPSNSAVSGLRAATTAPTDNGADDDSDSAMEADLAITSQTAFAREFLESAVSRTSLNDLTPNMQSALSSLRQMVAMQNNFASTRDFKLKLQQPMPPGGLQDLPMPPMKTVVSLLKMQKTAPPGIFHIACFFLDLDDLLDLCRKVYFCTDNISHAAFIIVNGSLYYFIADQIYGAKDAVVKAELEEYHRMCQVNLETALTTLPLMMPAKHDSVCALLIAAVYAINISKPSLAWHYNSTAATLCQILGYHRPSPIKHDSKPGQKDLRALVFWNTYMLDRTLAVRLGMPAVMQNWNITTPRRIDSSMIEDPWGPILTNWIEEADLGFRVYELLYSPAGMAKPEEERTLIARRLEAEQKQIMAAASQIREQALFGLRAINASELIDIHLRGDEITYRSTLTLIHRALPAPEGSGSRFTVESLDSARFALQLHHESIQSLELERDDLKVIFVHWTILLTPFAPFFVLFCYVIETSSPDDLRRLYDFVESLRPVTSCSESVQKLYQLCQVLCNVAHAYAEAKAQETPSGAPINREFDMYLSALGLPPTDMAVDPSGAVDAAALGQGMQVDPLANWFSGSQQVMGLLEEDISQFHGSWIQ
ncbi:fungal-specific transcription factor domain-containing protein [Plectosphaerella plurivora]|uniref:Fungal-specific transcription factor domain-containing protein n=1 Tax=Plectosphaerella plurivora TaxID=936078 RepID=A0A9P8VE48_9PEZI|nr:fungal-specific transcription factor domain-containing protein [Plectosphaerella plurivora]